MNRRDFLRTAGGAAGGTTALAASGTATAAEDGGGGGGSGGQPDWGGYLDGANNYNGSTTDLRGQEEVTISVGAGSNGLAFGPAAVWISPGTTVTWEWTGEGGSHNVVSDESDIDSGSPVGEAGYTYEVTFEEGGIHKYYCSPHQSSGMLGAIAVGDEVPTVSPESGGAKEVDPEQMGVPIQAHFVGIATVLAIGVSLVFTFFMLKYGESAHTKGGNN